MSDRRADGTGEDVETLDDDALTASLSPAVLGGPQVLLDERKHPDTPHWRWWATLLGEDDRGTWLATAPGTIARRGHEPLRQLSSAFVTLVPVDDPWLVECYLDHEFVTTYVNIGTVPLWSEAGDRVRQVDLDLDVMITLDGSVVVEDRDEFEDHRAVLGYPDELVALAEDATETVATMLAEDPGVFGAGPWLARLAELLDER